MLETWIILDSFAESECSSVPIAHFVVWVIDLDLKIPSTSQAIRYPYIPEGWHSNRRQFTDCSFSEATQHCLGSVRAGPNFATTDFSRRCAHLKPSHKLCGSGHLVQVRQLRFFENLLPHTSWQTGSPSAFASCCRKTVNYLFRSRNQSINKHLHKVCKCNVNCLTRLALKPTITTLNHGDLIP